jgi:predicted deacylase
MIAAPRTVVLGSSEDGRPIDLVHLGDPRGARVLVVGCIHGTECAGITIAHALQRTHTRADLWIVPNLNPDGSRIRLQEARRLMRVDDLDARSIAPAVGYESPSQFSREYRRHFGAAPAADAARLRRDASGRAA